MKPAIPHSREDAIQLDNSDRLADSRSAFKLPNETIYLVGHSLGPATHSAIARVRQTAEKEWANGIVGSWNSADWINLPQTVGSQLAPLIGVKACEVIVCDSVSVNLFKLAASALPMAGARKIIIEENEFPTDQYIAKGLCDISGADFIRIPEDQDRIAPGLLGEAVTQRAISSGMNADFVLMAQTGHVELIAPGTDAFEKTAELISDNLR